MTDQYEHLEGLARDLLAYEPTPDIAQSRAEEADIAQSDSQRLRLLQGDFSRHASATVILALIAENRAYREALKPFADLADRFTGPMVEVCNPHPDNPSRNIQPFATIHLERAFQAYVQQGGQSHDVQP